MAKAITAFREGDRSEYLAQSVFSTIGFVTTVTRQEDRFLTDLLVQLNVESGSAIPEMVEPTGLCIAVQVKSNFEPIIETRDPSAAALIAAFSHLPWFVAVADKKSGAINVYSTVRRHFWRNVSGFSIALESPPSTKAKVLPRTVYVGPPIVRAQIRNLDSTSAVKRSAARQRFRQTMLSWGSLDATNIAYRSLGIPAILLPRKEWSGGILRDEDLELHFIIDQVDPELVTRGTALALQTARVCLQRVGLDRTSARTRTIALLEMQELCKRLSALPIDPQILSSGLPLMNKG